MIDQLLEPVLGIVEGVLVREVEHDYPRLREGEVVVDNCAVPFLTGRVPEFQVEGGVGVRDLFEAVVDADGGLLGVELAIDVADEQGALANGRPADDDCFVVFETCVLHLAHLLRILLQIITITMLINSIPTSIFQPSF